MYQPLHLHHRRLSSILGLDAAHDSALFQGDKGIHETVVYPISNTGQAISLPRARDAQWCQHRPASAFPGMSAGFCADLANISFRHAPLRDCAIARAHDTSPYFKSVHLPLAFFPHPSPSTPKNAGSLVMHVIGATNRLGVLAPQGRIDR